MKYQSRQFLFVSEESVEQLKAGCSINIEANILHGLIFKKESAWLNISSSVCKKFLEGEK